MSDFIKNMLSDASTKATTVQDENGSDFIRLLDNRIKTSMLCKKLAFAQKETPEELIKMAENILNLQKDYAQLIAKVKDRNLLNDTVNKEPF